MLYMYISSALTYNIVIIGFILIFLYLLPVSPLHFGLCISLITGELKLVSSWPKKLNHDRIKVDYDLIIVKTFLTLCLYVSWMFMIFFEHYLSLLIVLCIEHMAWNNIWIECQGDTVIWIKCHADIIIGSSSMPVLVHGLRLFHAG